MRSRILLLAVLLSSCTPVDEDSICHPKNHPCITPAYCLKGTCLQPTCKSDADCPAGYGCEISSGQCELNCAASSDCESDLICYQGKCAPDFNVTFVNPDGASFADTCSPNGCYSVPFTFTGPRSLTSIPVCRLCSHLELWVDDGTCPPGRNGRQSIVISSPAFFNFDGCGATGAPHKLTLKVFSNASPSTEFSLSSGQPAEFSLSGVTVH